MSCSQDLRHVTSTFSIISKKGARTCMRGVDGLGVTGCRVRNRLVHHSVRREGLLPLLVQPTSGSTASLDLSPQEHQQEYLRVR